MFSGFLSRLGVGDNNTKIDGKRVEDGRVSSSFLSVLPADVECVPFETLCKASEFIIVATDEIDEKGELKAEKLIQHLEEMQFVSLHDVKEQASSETKEHKDSDKKKEEACPSYPEYLKT